MSKPIVSPFIYSLGLSTVVTNNQVSASPTEIINSLQVKYIPTSYSFAITFVVGNIDMTSSKNLFYKFINPDGKQIIQTPPFLINNLLINNKNEISFSMEMKNFDFPKEGKYISQVIIDGEIIGEFPIEVKKSVSN